MTTVPQCHSERHESTALSNLRIESFKRVQEADGSISLHTLGILPLPEPASLRIDESFVIWNVFPVSTKYHVYALPVKSRHLEISATIAVQSGCKRVGVKFRHATGFSTSASVFFLAESEEIIVSLSDSYRLQDVNRCDEDGPFTLFTQCLPGKAKQLEKLAPRLFVDNGVVKVFANDRFAMATMVYVREADALGISLFEDGEDDAVISRM